MAEESKGDRRLQYIGVGCFTVVTGFFSGAMIMVFVAKIVGTATKCVPPDGLPACDWHLYAGAGGVLGALSLPVIAIQRLMKGHRAADEQEK